MQKVVKSLKINRKNFRRCSKRHLVKNLNKQYNILNGDEITLKEDCNYGNSSFIISFGKEQRLAKLRIYKYFYTNQLKASQDEDIYIHGPLLPEKIKNNPEWAFTNNSPLEELSFDIEDIKQRLEQCFKLGEIVGKI